MVEHGGRVMRPSCCFLFCSMDIKCHSERSEDVLLSEAKNLGNNFKVVKPLFGLLSNSTIQKKILLPKRG